MSSFKSFHQFTHRFILLILFLGFTSTLPAQSTTSALEKSLLWEIKGNGLTQSSYLFGTIHLIPADKYLWTDKMESAFDASEEVVFEINMNDMTDINAMMGIMEHLFMDNDTTLSDLVSEEEYALIDKHFKKIGLPLFMFEKMKPFFLTVFMSEDFAPGKLQEGSLKSYEFELAEKAEATEKTIDGLETIEFQASIFDKIPYKAQADMLVASINASENLDEMSELDIMVEKYIQQDIQKLGEMIMGDNSSIGGFEEELLNNRNKAWIGIMISKMENKKVFFAVGAGHLPGEEGVIQLLRNSGFIVSPLN